jgi:IS30 family transposase
MPTTKITNQKKILIREFHAKHPCVDQDWIAKLVGVSQSTISRIINRSKK